MVNSASTNRFHTPDTGGWSRIGVSGSDRQELAALGVPFLALGILLVAAGLAALWFLPDWVRDYGPILVVVAYILHMTLALALVAWGFRLVHGGRGSLR